MGNAIKSNIRSIRIERGLTPYQLSRMLGFTSLDNPLIQQIENGHFTPKDPLLRRIADTLGVNMEALRDSRMLSKPKKTRTQKKARTQKINTQRKLAREIAAAIHNKPNGLPQYLISLRMETGLNRIKLAGILDIDRGALGRYERGHNLPSVERLTQIIEYLNGDVNKAIGLRDDYLLLHQEYKKAKKTTLTY